MSLTDKKKVTNKKYNDDKTTVYTFRCVHNTESDIIEKLNSVPNKAGYIKQLIRNDLQKT